MKLLIAAAALFLPTMAGAQTPEMMADIKAQCSKEWPGDFAMTEYCMARQLKAFVAMHEIYKSDRTDDESAMLDKCLTEWPRGTGHDWPMVEYCYNRQLAAYQRLQN